MADEISDEELRTFLEKMYKMNGEAAETIDTNAILTSVFLRSGHMQLCPQGWTKEEICSGTEVGLENSTVLADIFAGGSMLVISLARPGYSVTGYMRLHDGFSVLKAENLPAALCQPNITKADAEAVLRAKRPEWL